MNPEYLSIPNQHKRVVLYNTHFKTEGAVYALCPSCADTQKDVTGSDYEFRITDEYYHYDCDKCEKKHIDTKKEVFGIEI